MISVGFMHKTMFIEFFCVCVIIGTMYQWKKVIIPLTEPIIIVYTCVIIMWKTCADRQHTTD